MAKIHPTAVVDPGAKIADDAEIGPLSVIGGEVEIGPGAEIGPHVCISGRTTIGARTRIYPFSVLGVAPQMLGFDGQTTALVIGDDNIVERRYLDLGPVQEDGMIYVRDGLGGDETYIVEGLLRARPGLPVNPEARAEGG